MKTLKLNIALVEYKGVHCNIVYSDDNNGRALVLCYGMPGYPLNIFDKLVYSLVKSKFLVVIPQYQGTFDSDGLFNFKNSVESINNTVEYLHKGNIKDIISGKGLSLHIRDFIIIGGSYGASIALTSAATCKYISTVVSISAVTDYSNESFKFYKEEPISEEIKILKKIQPKTWRMKRMSEHEMCKNLDYISPLHYARRLKNKKVLIIHGKSDTEVNFLRSLDLFYSLKFYGNDNVKLILVDKLGHTGVGLLNKRSYFKLITEFVTSSNQ